MSASMMPISRLILLLLWDISTRAGALHAGLSRLEINGSKPAGPKSLTKSAAKAAKKIAKVIPGAGDIFFPPPDETVKKGCFTDMVADSEDKHNRKCPEECPFFAQKKDDQRHCTFQCVTAEWCPNMNPAKPIASKKLGVCRAPSVEACMTPMLDGTDRCEKCEWGYKLNYEGKCEYVFLKTLYVLAGVLGVVVALLVCWIVDLTCRPVTNEPALEAGLEFREALKVTGEIIDIREEQVQTGRRGRRQSTVQGWHSQKVWKHVESDQPLPLMMNLCEKDVCGPGLTLHFNFQAAVIVWALLMAAGWAALGLIVDDTLFELGMRPFGTPRDNCIVVAWGYENQQRLMWAKILYLWVAYVSSFLLALLHSVRQLRMYQLLDNDYKTMRDYAALLDGLPVISGDQPLEEPLTRDLENKLGCQLVGVSVAWNYKDKQDRVSHALRSELQQRHAETPSKQDSAGSGSEPASNPVREIMKNLEDYAFLPAPHEEHSDEDVTKLLSSISSSGNAFVVFQKEADRTNAIAKVKEEGLQFQGSELRLSMPHCEPTTVQWQNFDRSGHSDIGYRTMQGVGSILGALVGWTVFFYAPYAWSIYNFDYENGKQPGFIYGLSFSMVVVIGNNIMYAVCDSVSEKIGFRFKDDKEAAYMILYTVACTLNVLLDFGTTYFSAWSIMKGLGFHTYDGRLLSEVEMWPEGFETYAMQRSLAENVYDYAFPSTFFLPFVLEPLLSTVLPLQLTKLFIRTHKGVKASTAEEIMVPAPLELGRYGDILLNVVIFIMIFFFPGAYTTKLGLLMALCHMMIYAWDHYRVLRVVPNATFASLVIDWWSQAMLAPCCALILSALIFKSYTQWHGMGGWATCFICSGAFILHCVVHLLLLIYVVPCFSLKHEDLDSDATYEELAKETRSNWFNTNPVHCLRSKYVLKESQPCAFFIQGRDQKA